MAPENKVGLAEIRVLFGIFLVVLPALLIIKGDAILFQFYGAVALAAAVIKTPRISEGSLSPANCVFIKARILRVQRTAGLTDRIAAFMTTGRMAGKGRPCWTIYLGDQRCCEGSDGGSELFLIDAALRP